MNTRANNYEILRQQQEDRLIQIIDDKNRPCPARDKLITIGDYLKISNPNLWDMLTAMAGMNK